MEQKILFLCTQQMITAAQLIEPDIPVLAETFDISEALRFMDEFKVHELPVVVDGDFKGLVSEIQLLDLDESERNIMPPLARWHVQPQDHFFTLVHQLAEYKSSIATVLDGEGHYVGCVTRAGVLQAMGQMVSAHQEGGVIALEVSARDYSLQQITRIVEENGSKVLTLMTYPNEKGMLEILLKLSSPDINSIVRSLERFEYRVITSYQSSQASQDMWDRYDTLMRFLDE